MHILHRYIIKQFIVTLALCLLTVISLFLIIDLFERSRIFLREDAAILDAVSYMLYKIPLIISIMMPIAMLIATLLTVGKLSQSSEITAMRACGVSVLWLSKPLIGCGLVVSFLMFISGETIVPFANAKVENIYQFNIKKNLEKGIFSRNNFWYRSRNNFYNMSFYNSKEKEITDFTLFEFDKSERLKKRVDSPNVKWVGKSVGWVMYNVTQTLFSKDGRNILISHFKSLPLVIPEEPKDFYDLQLKPDTMSYKQLGSYIAKLRREKVPTISYEVKQAAKISFPFINLIVILVAVPFALASARSGTLTISFVIGISIGFSYYIIHATNISLGNAELIPSSLAAWGANILLGAIGGYLMTSVDYN